MKVSVGVSNRHIHLKKEDLEILFGEGYELKILRNLKQPMQYASTDTVLIKTPKAEIPNVRVLGPIRSYTQVEISRTDAFKLGLNPPIRDSGDLIGSCGITVIGPKGVLNLDYGCIIPTRHIHISKTKLKELGFDDNSKVKIKVDGNKGGILDNVTFKVSDDAYFELHLDLDDANSHFLNNDDLVDIIKDNDK